MLKKCKPDNLFTVIRHHHRLPSIPWWVRLAIHQWCAALQIPSPQNSASASVGSADGPRPQTTVAGQWGLGSEAVSAELRR